MLNLDTYTQRGAKKIQFSFVPLGDDISRKKFSVGVLSPQKKNINNIKLQSLNKKENFILLQTEPSESCLTPSPNSQSFLSSHRKLNYKKSIIKSGEKSELILEEREKQILIETFKKKSPQEMQQIIQEQKKEYEQEKQIKQKELEKAQEEYNQFIDKSVRMTQNEFQNENAQQIKKIQSLEEEKNAFEQLIAQSQITTDSIQTKVLSGDQEKLYQELENMWRLFKLENKKEYNEFKKEYNPNKLNIHQIVYRDENIIKKVNEYFIVPGGKFGSDALIYEDNPQICHSKYTLNKTCDNLIAINRLSEKTDKIPLISNPPIKIIRKYRRKTRKEKKEQKIILKQHVQ